MRVGVENYGILRSVKTMLLYVGRYNTGQSSILYSTRSSGWTIGRFLVATKRLYIREAGRGSLSLSVLCIKNGPNHEILRCSLATGTLYLLPKSLRQRYSESTVSPDTALTLPS